MAAHDLDAYGIAVVQMSECDALAAEIWCAMDTFAEFKAKGRTVQRVLGGFGALGNPSSFHHEAVRRLRGLVKRHVAEAVFAPYAAAYIGEGVALEALFDRLCVRWESFCRPTPDAWHRDVYDAHGNGLRPLPASLPGGTPDQLFGGWLNLDNRSQSLVALVGTHRPSADLPEGFDGFATFDADAIRAARLNERLAAQANQHIGNTLHTDATGAIVVPPGHLVLFAQRLVHAVKSGPQPPTPALRLFHGFRLTCETVPLFGSLHTSAIATGGVPRLPSGQLPAMYSKNHYAAFARASGTRWRAWGEETFHDACLFARVSGAFAYKTPGSKDDRNPWANRQRVMPSLSEMGLMGPAYVYTDADRAVMAPERL